jgi:nucleotide-binding universal stress UspA family protein
MCLISLRKKKPDLDRGYKVPLVPWVPLLGILFNALLVMYIWNFPGGAGQVAWYVALFAISGGLILHYFTGGKEAIEKIPEAKRIEILDLISKKVEVDMKKYRVLVPMATFEDSKLVEFGANMAIENEGELAIMNVVEVPSTLPVSAVRFGDVDEKIKSLQKLGKSVKRPGLEPRILLKISHKVYENILEVVEEESVDFLVLGWRGKHTKRGILGSNLDYVVQRANCDVAVFKTEGLKDRLGSILVLSAGGIHTQDAVGIASKLARSHNGKVVILAVVTNESSRDIELKNAQKLIALCKVYGVDHELKVVTHHSIIPAVTKEAEGHDLLVIGAGPVWKMRKYAFGPHLDKLCKEVSIPVLMFRKGLR